MANKNNDPLADIRQKAEKLQNDMKKTLGTQMDKLADVMKKAEYPEQKRIKLNKLPATIMLGTDNSVKIVFDNPEDGKKFYEGKKK